MDPNLAIQPYLIAISYLLTTEISFSIWFFALVDNLLRALASAMTLTETTRLAWGVQYSLNSLIFAVAGFGVRCRRRRRLRFSICSVDFATSGTAILASAVLMESSGVLPTVVLGP